MYHMKTIKRLILLFVLFGSMATFASPDISGYFDIEFISPNTPTATKPFFRQHHVNIMLQQSVKNYNFFTEIEFEDATDLNYGRTPVGNDNAKPKTGRLFIERAYGEATFNPLFNIRAGQMLHTSLYLQNHYPSLTSNFTDPSTRKTIFDYNVKGLAVWGQSNGLYYDAWTGRGPEVLDNTVENEAGMNWGAKLAYTLGSGEQTITFALLTAEYANKIGLGVDKSAGVEMVLNWNEYGLTSEFGSRTDDITPNNTIELAGYLIGTYRHDLDDGAELIPFIMYDTYKTKNQEDAKKRLALGLNYKPNTSVTTKLEYLVTPEYKDTATTTKAKESQVAAAFIYFYN